VTRRTRDSGDRDIEAADFGRGRARRPRALPKCYSIKTVAEALEVSDRTIRRWIDQPDLVAHRPGGVIRIAEDDLRAFLALHRDS
jgi:excisionase family DNA binding protein